MIPVFSLYREGSVDSWIDTCGALFGIAPLNGEDTQKHHYTSSWFIDPISISASHYYGMAAQHRRWHVEESGAQIHVHRYVHGSASVESDGLPIECDTNAITLLDYGRPFTSLHTNNECQSFFVPYTAIGYQPSDAPHALVYSGQSRIGQLIGREMDNILSQLTGGASALLAEDIQRFLGCVEVAMSPETASPSASQRVRESLKRAIQLFIEQRLASPDLNTTLILQNFGVSRPSLYRLFDAEDGVRTYINHRRLVRAVTELASAPLQRGNIHKVSERWGFNSDASFNRMVKREFGVAPGSLFGMPIRFGNESPVSEIQAWMIERAKPRHLELA